jgi:hypothetical protein
MEHSAIPIAFTANGSPIVLSQQERQRHIYVAGKTGSGKSTLMCNLAMDDIRAGEGVAFIDPHGDAALGQYPTQGNSVALSADGNTAIVGGNEDNVNIGAAWVFTRKQGVWTQQGSKLIGTGAVGAPYQASSVALSADGNTAIVGEPGDNGSPPGQPASYTGAAWVFTRGGGQWTQQGSKLVGTGAGGQYGAAQGASVSLSADGNTAIVGGPEDDSSPQGSIGAAWVFTRKQGVWTQQGSKLVGTGAVGAPNQGNSVALSADGNTAIVGGWLDNPLPASEFVGAAWVFVRPD